MMQSLYLEEMLSSWVYFQIPRLEETRNEYMQRAVIKTKTRSYLHSPLKPTEHRSRYLNRRRPCYRHNSQAIDVLGSLLPRQRRKRDPGHPLRDRALDHAFPVNIGWLVINHVRLVHPADIQFLAQVLLAHRRRIKAEGNRSTAPSRFASHLCL